jgi:TP901 family phage tail tape measure protein
MAGFGKEYSLIFQLDGKVSSSLTNAFNSVSNKFSNLSNISQNLKFNVANIEKYNFALQKQNNFIEKIQNAENKRNVLQTKFSNGEITQKQFDKEFLKQSNEISNYNKKLENTNKNITSIGNSLENAGVDTKNLVSETVRLNKEFDKIENAKQNYAKLEQQNADLSKSFYTSLSLLKTSAAVSSAGVAGFYKAAVAPAIEFESAFTGVAKTVDGTAQQLSSLQNRILTMSKTMPASAADIAKVAESAGQLGIELNNIPEFSKVIIDVSNSTNLDYDTASSSFAKFANITKMSQNDFDKLGSSVVALGNNFATSEADIVEMSMRLGSAGTQIGLSQAEITGVAAALSSVGLEAENGGTALSRVFADMQVAVETGGESLTNFSKISGKTEKEFKNLFKENSIGALQEFIKGLSNAENSGQSAIAMLDEMGVSEVRVRDALLRLANSSELLTQATDLSSNAWKENNALATEAEKRYSTTESQIQITKNAINSTAISIGKNFLPNVLSASNEVLNFAVNLDYFVKNNPKRVKSFVETAASIGGVALGIAGITAAGIGSAKGINTLALGFSKIGLVIKNAGGLGAFLKSLATTSNVIGASVAVIGGAVIAYKAYEASVVKASKAASDAKMFNTNGTKLTELVGNFETATNSTSNFVNNLQNLKDKFDETEKTLYTANSEFNKFIVLSENNVDKTEVENLSESFEILTNSIKNHLDSKYDIIYEGLYLPLANASTDAANTAGEEIARIAGLLEKFKSAQKKDVENAEKTAQNYYAKIEKGEMPTAEETADYQKSLKVISIYSQDYNKKYAGLQLKKDVEGINFGANAAEALVTVEKFNENLNSQINGINSAIEENNKVLYAETAKIEELYNENLIDITERKNRLNAVNSVVATSNQNLQQQAKEVTENAKSTIDIINKSLETAKQEFIKTALKKGDILVDLQSSLYTDLNNFTGKNVDNRYQTLYANKYGPKFNEQNSALVGAIEQVNQTANSPITDNNAVRPTYNIASFAEKYKKLPKHATGSAYAENAFIAGENGPELILGAGGSRVYTSNQTEQIFNNLYSSSPQNSENNVNVSVSFSLDFQDNNIDYNTVSSLISSKLKSEIEPILNERARRKQRLAFA